MGKHVPKSSISARDLPLAILNGKWKAAILHHVKEHPSRYSELRASIPGLSDKMLTQRLHDLMDSGLVRHRRSAGGPTGLYALTPRGKLLHGLLLDIRAWGRQHAGAFRASGSTAPKASVGSKKAR
jgi:DNA-binding HxlR family transcriptional regulator